MNHKNTLVKDEKVKVKKEMMCIEESDNGSSSDTDSASYCESVSSSVSEIDSDIEYQGSNKPKTFSNNAQKISINDFLVKDQSMNETKRMKEERMQNKYEEDKQQIPPDIALPQLIPKQEQQPNSQNKKGKKPIQKIKQPISEVNINIVEDAAYIIKESNDINKQLKKISQVIKGRVTDIQKKTKVIIQDFEEVMRPFADKDQVNYGILAEAKEKMNEFLYNHQKPMQKFKDFVEKWKGRLKAFTETKTSGGSNRNKGQKSFKTHKKTAILKKLKPKSDIMYLFNNNDYTKLINKVTTTQQQQLLFLQSSKDHKTDILQITNNNKIEYFTQLDKEIDFVTSQDDRIICDNTIYTIQEEELKELQELSFNFKGKPLQVTGISTFEKDYLIFGFYRNERIMMYKYNSSLSEYKKIDEIRGKGKKSLNHSISSIKENKFTNNQFYCIVGTRFINKVEFDTNNDKFIKGKPVLKINYLVDYDIVDQDQLIVLSKQKINIINIDSKEILFTYTRIPKPQKNLYLLSPFPDYLLTIEDKKLVIQNLKTEEYGILEEIEDFEMMGIIDIQRGLVLIQKDDLIQLKDNQESKIQFRDNFLTFPLPPVSRQKQPTVYSWNFSSQKNSS